MITSTRALPHLVKPPIRTKNKCAKRPPIQNDIQPQKLCRARRSFVSKENENRLFQDKNIIPKCCTMSAIDIGFNSLNSQEKNEIKSYKSLYSFKRKIITADKKDNSDRYYPFKKDDHICYRYQQISELGRGSYGSVIMCLDHKLDKKVAVKLIKDENNIHKQILIEKEVSEAIKANDPKFTHKTPIFYECFVYHGFYGFVYELLGSDVYTSIKNNKYQGLDSARIHIVAKNVAEALMFIHKLGYVHCDLKPENILWTNIRRMSARLIDFGCCCRIGEPILKYVQSRFYRAPEVIIGADYGKEIDIWSFGCVLYEMATGSVLFPGANEREQIGMYVAALGPPTSSELRDGTKVSQYFNNDGSVKEPVEMSPIFDLLNCCDVLLSDLILKCLKWDPEDRITIPEILDHPFMDSNY